MNKILIVSCAAALVAAASLFSTSSPSVAHDTEAITVRGDDGGMVSIIISRDLPNIPLMDVTPAIIRSSAGFRYPKLTVAPAASLRQPPVKTNGRPDPLLRWRSRFIA